ncbi:MAG: transposase [Verrucomicrobiota bacterium]
MPHIDFRKTPHHFEIATSPHQIHFVTVCTHQRKRLLDQDHLHQTLIRLWSDSKYWRLGKYVMMPDHLHFFAKPSGQYSMSLKNWISYWKRAFVRIHGKEISHPFWQKDFWDTRLRRSDSYTSKWLYVENNPIRHGLVRSIDHWKFKGEIHLLSF